MLLLHELLLILTLYVSLCYAFFSNSSSSDPLATTCVGGGVACFGGKYAADSGTINLTFIFPTRINWLALGIGPSLDSTNLIVLYRKGNRYQIAQAARTNDKIVSIDATMFALDSRVRTSISQNVSQIALQRPVLSTVKGMQTWPSGLFTYYWALNNGSVPLVDVTQIKTWTSTSGDSDTFRHGYFTADFGEFSVQDLQPRFSEYKHLLLVHGVLMFAAWSVVLPLGIFVARYLKRRLGPYWFPTHWFLMVFVVSGLTVAGIVYAYKARKVLEHSMLEQLPPVTSHGIVSYVQLALFAAQICLGVIIDQLWNPERKETPWRDVAHWWLGRIVALVSIASVVQGLVRYGSIIGRQVVLYGVVICLGWIMILEFIGFVIFRRGDRAKEKSLTTPWHSDRYSLLKKNPDPLMGQIKGYRYPEPVGVGDNIALHLPTTSREMTVTGESNHLAPPSPTKRNPSVLHELVKSAKRFSEAKLNIRPKSVQSISKLIPKRNLSRFQNIPQPKQPALIYPKESIYDHYMDSNVDIPGNSKVSLVPLPANFGSQNSHVHANDTLLSSRVDHRYFINPYNSDEQVGVEEKYTFAEMNSYRNLLPSAKSQESGKVVVVSPGNNGQGNVC